MRGDRKDPEWAWYWAEVDAETKRTAYGVIPPEAIDLHKREKFWDAFATTSDPERDPWRKDFLVMAQWLSAKQQKILATAYPGGERVSSGWKTLSISQAKWAQALISSEARLVQIAIAWKAAPLSKRTLEGALKRVEHPQILLNYIEFGSSAKCALHLGLRQQKVHKLLVRMALEEPMVQALMAMRAGHRRESSLAQAQELRCKALPKQLRKYKRP